MSITDWIFCFSLTSAIPGIIYLIRLPKIGFSNSIILLYSLVATLVEITTHCSGIHSSIICNLFVLFESVLFYVLLTKWQLHSLYSNRNVILPLTVVSWIGTTLFFGIGERNVIFRILYSFLLVIGSINVINHLLFENKPLYRDFRFIICIGLVFFYTFNIIVETFCSAGIKFSGNFRINLFFIKVAFNIFCNLLFAIAVLCIPKK